MPVTTICQGLPLTVIRDLLFVREWIRERWAGRVCTFPLTVRDYFLSGSVEKRALGLAGRVCTGTAKKKQCVVGWRTSVLE